MKKNLEMFKMNKTQMNDVNGGQRFVCTITDGSGWEHSEVVESGVSQDDAVDILNEAYGDWAFVTCHSVLN